MAPVIIMDIVEIVKKFCERKNLKFEFFPEHQFNEQNFDEKIDNNTVCLTDHKYGLLPGKKYDYCVIYGELSSILLKTMSIVEVIDAVKKITTQKEKTECSVCYESCEMVANKCKKCNSSTCPSCRGKGLVLKNTDYVIKIADLMGKKGMSDNSIAKLISKISHLFPSFCPVCREDQRTEEEKESFEFLTRCDEFLV